MTDIAALGLAIESTSAKTAAANLNTFTKSAAGAESSAERLSRASKAVASEQRGLGVAAAGSSQGLRMASMQLSQVAQQGAATGDYVRALAIQLPDLALGFGAVGIALGVAAGVILPFISDMISGAGRANEMRDSLDALAGAVKDYQSAVEAAVTPTEELIEEFGTMAREARAAYSFLAEAKLEEAMSAQRTALSGLREEFASLFDVLTQYEKQVATLAEYEADSVAPSIVAIQQQSVQILSDLAEDLLSNLELTTDQGIALRDAIAEIQPGTEGAAAAAADLLALLTDTYGSAAAIPPELREASEILAETTVEAARLQGGLEAADAAAREIASTDLAAGIGDAANEAARLAQNLAAASGGRATGFSDGELALLRMGGERIERPGAIRRRTTSPRRVSRSSGGGMSDESRAAERAASDDLREKERLFDATRTKAEEYGIALAKLTDLHKRGVIDTDLYTRGLDQLDDKYSSTLDTMSQFQQAQKDIADAFADAIVNGEDFGESMGRIFKQIAADILSSNIERALGGLLEGLGSRFGATGNNAGGTNFWRGGRTWVGEQGPEVVTLPRGSQVTPASQSGVSVPVTVNNYTSDEVNVTTGSDGRIDVEIRKQMSAWAASSHGRKAIRTSLSPMSGR